ncbi:MAG: hypothetical protein HC824_04525 [Synechococcales cyanobacterium RM1_1_8]|nr:hypothetical protein [Synechococcales cyanobacterium RM1_1_8]
MAYSDFKLEQVIEQFSLRQIGGDLFKQVGEVAPSPWLVDTLSVAQRVGIQSGTEKARSEFIVAPILLELVRQNPGHLSVYSGKSLDVDKQLGLNGECDFLISRSPGSRIIQAPLVSVVEAKRQDLEVGLGQCSAQMLGAKRFNQQKQLEIDAIYGCVTTGDLWQFLKLEDDCLTIEDRTYGLSAELGRILGIFKFILDHYP